MSESRVRLVIIILVLTLLIWCICCELQRQQGKVVLSAKKFYGHPATVLMAPFNRWCLTSSRHSTGNPFPDMLAHFPSHVVLKHQWWAIREEALSLYKHSHIRDDKNVFFSRIGSKEWKRFHIKWYNEINSEAKQKCPFTSSLIHQLPEIQSAMFSILGPGGIIPPHVGPFRGCVRYHLGLDCPEECGIEVDGNRYEWKDGQDVLFDDTFVHHVWNHSDRPRIILFCDVERLMNTHFASLVNRTICKIAGPLTTAANNIQEKVVSSGKQFS